MLSNIFKFIQNNLIKLLFFNTLIYIVLLILFVLPMRIFFDLPIKGMNVGGINEGVITKNISKAEERIFLNSLNGINIDNDYVNFGENIRIGISIYEGKHDYIRKYGFITFNGQFKNEKSKFAFLEYLGVSDEQIEEYKSNNSKVYDVATDMANCTIIDSGTNNRVEINIQKNISEDDKISYHINPGKSIKSLEEQSSMLAYILTVNEITSKTAFLKSLLIFLFEVIIVVLINIVYIVGKIKKK